MNFLLSMIYVRAGGGGVDVNAPSPHNLAAWVKPPYPDGYLKCYAFEHASILTRPPSTDPSQFVGGLSFRNYAMHNTVRWIIWERSFVQWQFAYFGDEPQLWHFLSGYLVMTLLVFGAAEGFRHVKVFASPDNGASWTDQIDVVAGVENNTQNRGVPSVCPCNDHSGTQQHYYR